MKIGKFISFEGGEGSGKTTQIEKLSQRFNARKISIFVTREPGGTIVGEKIRQILVQGSTDKLLPTTELLLHTASRFEHLNISIAPMLKKGKIVICDRFIDSTIAYQGIGHDLSISKVEQIHNHVGIMLRPDFTFILDIPVQEGLKRSKLRKNNETRYESMNKSFHEKIRRAYIDIAKKNPKRYLTVDAQRPAEEISEIIWNTLNKKFDFKNYEQR